MGSRGSGSSLQSHFESENNRIKEFMNNNKNEYESIQMSNGQVIEKYSMQDLKDMLKDVKKGYTTLTDESYFITYNNGSTLSVNEETDLKQIKLTGIKSIIYEGSETIGYAGKGVNIVNYKEKYPKDYPHSKGYEDDWRIE